MIEVVVSRARKVNGKPYENQDIFCSLKSQILDTGQAETELNKLNQLATAFVDREANKIKEGQNHE